MIGAHETSPVDFTIELVEFIDGRPIFQRIEPSLVHQLQPVNLRIAGVGFGIVLNLLGGVLDRFIVREARVPKHSIVRHRKALRGQDQTTMRDRKSIPHSPGLHCYTSETENSRAGRHPRDGAAPAMSRGLQRVSRRPVSASIAHLSMAIP